ncbi:MAG: immunoglobulin domain-containing protein, partial [Bacteroidota bacterium]
TSASGVAAQQPDGSHSVMGFRYGGKLYSTGSESTITSVLTAAGYTTAGTTGTGTGYVAGNFRALPIKDILGTVPNSGPNLIVLGSKIDGSATTQIATAPNVTGLSVRDVLIDGTRGLNLGTGVTNLPSTSVLTFEATNIVANGVADGVPDIVVSQIAEPTDGSASVYSFTDANGNIVGYPVQVVFSSTSIPVIGRYKSDFFTLPVGQPISTAQINGSLLIGANTRDIRMVAYKIGDFGVNTTNAIEAKHFKVMPSGTSDPAFMAYNRNRFLIPAPEITGQPNSQAICPGGTATFTVTAAATSTGTEAIEYQWLKNGEPVENGNGITGANAATLSINPITAAHAGAYRCLVTNASGAALSNTAYLNTIITAGPDVSTCINAAASIDVSALGNTPTYKWYSNTTNSNIGGTLIPSATAATYSPPVTTAGTYYYYAVSRPANLACTEADVKSDPIKFTVVSGAQPGVITEDQSVCPGGYAA